MGIYPWGNTSRSIEAAKLRRKRAEEFCLFLKANEAKYDKGNGYYDEEKIAADLGISRGEVRERYKDMVLDLMERTEESKNTLDFLVHRMKRKLMPDYNKACINTEKEVFATLQENAERF
jgi:hypothetical protein